MRVPFAILMCFVVLASADVVGKNGESRDPSFSGDAGTTSSQRGDFEFNTTGYMDCEPTMAGSGDGWGQWFVTVLFNDSGHALKLTELGFPCTGPSSDEWGWVVWTNLAQPAPPVSGPESADFHGSYVPEVDDGETPPQVYSYVDLSAENIVVGEGAWYGFGFQVTDLGGQVEAGGVNTWSWFWGSWDSDAPWGRKAVLQLKADFEAVATHETSWSDVKRLY